MTQIGEVVRSLQHVRIDQATGDATAIYIIKAMAHIVLVCLFPCLLFALYGLFSTPKLRHEADFSY